MTYYRMKAKPIAGQHCRFCGDPSALLVKTRCCDQWICCDTEFFSFRGGGGTANLSTNTTASATFTLMKVIQEHGRTADCLTKL